MLLLIRRNNQVKAQTFLEYSILIVITVGALLFMYNYLNRSIQGRYKEEIDKANPTGDYTTISGNGTRTKTVVGTIWEQRDGYVIAHRSSWLRDTFSYDTATETPLSLWP